MNCHVCSKKLTLADNFNFNVYLECPNGHAYVTLKGNDIIQYKLVWDLDEHASERYWLESINQENKETKVIKSNYRSYGKITNFKNIRPDGTILALDYFMPLKLKDDTIQIDNIVPRLKKLIAFI